MELGVAGIAPPEGPAAFGALVSGGGGVPGVEGGEGGLGYGGKGGFWERHFVFAFFDGFDWVCMALCFVVIRMW